MTADLLHIPTLKDICARAGMLPERSEGQNFLTNARTLAQIVAVVDPQQDDVILEVGAGFGVLTEALAPHAQRVVAVEKDTRVVPLLRERLAAVHNVDVVEGDILALLRASPSRKRLPDVLASPHASSSSALLSGAHALYAGQWKIAANLPYSITSDFFRLLFDRVADGTLPPPERVVLLVQLEVAHRLIGTTKRDRGILTILAALHSTPRRVARVPASHFWPAPKVESAVMVFDHWRTPEKMAALLGRVSRDTFLTLVRTAFANRRKQLRNSIGGSGSGKATEACLAEAGIAPTVRPEELDLPQWIALAHALHNMQGVKRRP